MTVAANWMLTMNTPFGVQTPLLSIREENGGYAGTLTGASGASPLEDLKVDGTTLSFLAKIATPMGKFPVTFTASVAGDSMTGSYQTMMGKTEFTGVRQK